ncbi:MAG: hypothetical protein JXB10_02815 [Pirellulales bacterium]|nr:hypothetical protein [Pirellulales bacterium]
MWGLSIFLPSAEAVVYLANLALAASLTCAAGIAAVRAFRRGTAPLRHGILAGTLCLLLLSPAAVWLAQHNGLALVRIPVTGRSVAHRANAPSPTAAGITDKTPAANKSFPETVPPHNSLIPGPAPIPYSSPDTTQRSRKGENIKTRSERPSAETPPEPPVSAAGPRSAAGDPAVSAEDSPVPAWCRTVGSLAALIWSLGFAVGLFRLSWGCLVLARFYRRLRPLTNPRQLSLARQAAKAVGLRRRPPMFLSPAVSVPVTVGLFRPAIVLPELMIEEMGKSHWQAVLLHESAHVARGDLWVGLGQRIAAIIFWWHPLVHWIGNAIAELREEICDNYVVSVQGEGRRLAGMLVDWAARAARGPLWPSTVGVLRPRLTGLSGRVAQLVDPERGVETRMSFRMKVIVFACGLAMLIGMATVGSLQLAHAQSSRKSPPGATDLPSATSPGTPDPAEAPDGKITSTARSKIKPHEAEAALLKAIRANREKLKCGVLSWSRTTKDAGFSDVGEKSETAGAYKLWWDGEKMATAYIEDRVCKGSDRPMWIEVHSGGSSYDGGFFSIKPRLGLYENWLDYVTRWNSREKLLTSILNKSHVEIQRSVVEAAGRKQLKLVAKNKNDGAYSIQCFDLSRGGQLLEDQSYTAQKRLYAIRTCKLQKVSEGVWFPVEVDEKSIKEGKATLHQHYVLDLEQSSFNDRKALPAGIFRLSAGEIEHQHQDELRTAYEKAKNTNRQAEAGKQKGSAAARSEGDLRAFFRRFEEAVTRNDKGAVARLLGKHKGGEEATKTIQEMKEAIEQGATPFIIRSVVIRGDQALVVTDFFDFSDSRYEGKQCLIYRMVRDDGWVIEDIDMENVNTLVGEVRRFDAR